MRKSQSKSPLTGQAAKLDHKLLDRMTGVELGRAVGLSPRGSASFGGKG